MHIFFPVARARRVDGGDTKRPEALPGAVQLHAVRDPDDESEWQYLGNPEIAARASLQDVVARFILDCRGADGMIDPEHVIEAGKLRDALLMAARQIEDALAPPTQS